MKATVQTREFIESISPCVHLIDGRATDGIKRCLLLTFKGDSDYTVEAITQDSKGGVLSASMLAYGSAGVESEGKVCVHGGDFLEALKSFSGATTTISQPKARLRLESDKMKYDLNTVGADAFPRFGQPKQVSVLSLAFPDLVRLAKACVPVVQEKKVFNSLNLGMYLHLVDDKLETMCAHNEGAARARAFVTAEGEAWTGMLAPAALFDELMRLPLPEKIQSEALVKIIGDPADPGFVKVVLPGYVIKAATIQGDFKGLADQLTRMTDFRSPSFKGIKVNFAKEDMIRAIRGARHVREDGTHTLLAGYQGTLHVETKSFRGSAESDIPYGGDSFERSILANCLALAVDICEKEAVAYVTDNSFIGVGDNAVRIVPLCAIKK